MGLKEVIKDSVAFLMPCGGPVEPRVMQSALVLAGFAHKKGISVGQVGMTDRTLVHTARNFLAEGLLLDTTCEWSFWMDSDMLLEPRTIEVLLRRAKYLNAKMVTGIYYQRQGQHKPIIWKKELESSDGAIVHNKARGFSNYFVYPKTVGGHPFKIDVAGFGCTLIHRDVFDAMKKPYFKFEFYEEDGEQKEASEDFYFFEKAKELGFQLWAIPELDCGHIASGKVIRHADMLEKLDMADMTEMKTEQKEEAVK